MNPYYQFSMIEGVKNAEVKIIESGKSYSRPQKEQIIADSIITSPIKQPALTYEPTPSDSGISTSSKGGGGGGGGGGGISPSKPKSKASTPTKPKKSFIPLVAIGAGIAILILKPF